MTSLKYSILSVIISLIPFILHSTNAYSTTTTRTTSTRTRTSASTCSRSASSLKAYQHQHQHQHNIIYTDESTTRPGHGHGHGHGALPKAKAKATAFTSPLPLVVQKGISTLALTAAIAISSSATNLPAAHAESGYDTSASASYNNGEDTVELVIQNLKDATGDNTKSFQVFETINSIITEGAGVGGSLSYKGVNLERGYVADEDTTVYNPGLSLMTETEKSSIVNGIIQNRKGNVSTNSWSKENEAAFESLKTRLDPLHMVELSSYLKVMPFIGGAMYLVALGVQQFARDSFEIAYVVSALVVFLPVFAFIAIGV